MAEIKALVRGRGAFADRLADLVDVEALELEVLGGFGDGEDVGEANGRVVDDGCESSFVEGGVADIGLGVDEAC